MGSHDDFLADVERYVSVRERIAELEEERKALGERMAEHLRDVGAEELPAPLEGGNYAVKLSERVSVDYDEALLRERLGADYASILSIDVKRLRAREEQAREWLGPHFEEVARPDRRLVKRLVESGRVSAAAFQGAFERRVSRSVAVKGGPRSA